MSSGKAELARAGTMQVTAKEGTAYLSKNLTDWKKPYLLADGEEEDSAEDPPASSEDNAEVEEEEEEEEVEPPVKKARFSKATTMVGTAKEAKALLGAEKLADTRQETKIQKAKSAKAKKAALKRAGTMAKAKQDAEAVYGEDLDLSEGRSLRKRKNSQEKPAEKPKAKKASLKKAGTMQVTAKEGEDFLKRTKKAPKGKKGKGKGKK